MKPGPSIRMILDADGVLHPLRKRKSVKAVALVRITTKPKPPRRRNPSPAELGDLSDLPDDVLAQLSKGAQKKALIDRSHRTMAEVMAEEGDRVEPANSGVVAPPATARAMATAPAADPAVPPPAAVDMTVQRRCRLCGDWRVTACNYRTCPLPRADVA